MSVLVETTAGNVTIDLFVDGEQIYAAQRITIAVSSWVFSLRRVWYVIIKHSYLPSAYNLQSAPWPAATS